MKAQTHLCRLNLDNALHKAHPLQRRRVAECTVRVATAPRIFACPFFNALPGARHLDRRNCVSPVGLTGAFAERPIQLSSCRSTSNNKRVHTLTELEKFEFGPRKNEAARVPQVQVSSSELRARKEHGLHRDVATRGKRLKRNR